MTGVNRPDRDAGEREHEPGNSAGSLPFEPAVGQGREGCIDEEILADELGDAERDEDERRVTGIIKGDAPDLNSLRTAAGQRDEYLDSLRRLQAEFENYKKRVVKQQADQTARAAASLVEKILPVLDTLDLAIEHVDPGSADGRALEAVSSQLRDVLTKEGLERISPIGERFDPTAHEAVGHLAPEGHPEADNGNSDATHGDGEPVVAQVMRAGYRWKGVMLRPAMVMVEG
jgi:molecular chaperone GrpE